MACFWLMLAVLTLMGQHAVRAGGQMDDATVDQLTWGIGDHYKLATDADGWSIVEPGTRHRQIYAAADGSKDNSGLSPDSPVNLKVGQRMIRKRSSDWLLLRRGDVFDSGIFLGENMLGESPLRPILIGAYGEGPRPIVQGVGAIKSFPRGNIVIRDLRLRGGRFRVITNGPFENVLVENVLMDNASGALVGTIRHLTIRRCVIKDCHREQPKAAHRDPNVGWARDPLGNRHQGLFANKVHGLLVEESVLDHNGWEEGYVESGGGPDDPQPPSMYSHNLYLSTKNRDLTVRGNINARAASQALRDGSGQFYVGNVMIANNIGGYSGAGQGRGNYTTFADNVLIHPAAKRGPKIGGRGWGWSMKDIAGSQALCNIFAHAPSGQNQPGLKRTEGVLVEDHVRYQWHEREDLNPTGEPFPDPDRTIMTYDREFGSGRGTIEGFMAQATAQSKSNWRPRYGAKALVEYFQKGFGIWPGERTEPGTITFTAEGGDRVRWDNRFNWSDEHLPIDGDVVRLDGHEVYYSGTLDLQSLDLGDGGVLHIHQGRLTLDRQEGPGAGPPGGSVLLDRSGYLVLHGLAGNRPINFAVRSGRLENRGEISGADVRIEATGGELCLAGAENNLHLGSGSMLRLIGPSVQAGYYGRGAGRISFENGSALRFTCDEQGLSTLGEIRGEEQADSSLVISPDRTVLAVDLEKLRLPTGEHSFVLADVDRLRGRFAEERITGAGAAAIDGAEIEYDEPAGQIRLRLVSSGDRAHP